MREIHIMPVLNGWVVQVGCQRVVFTRLGSMLSALYEYATNPKATEEKYLANAINKDVRLDIPQPSATSVGMDARY